MTSSPRIYPCPDCARVLQFQHPDTNIILCVCGSVLYRDEGGSIQTKAFNTVLEKNDAVAPGVTGTWKNQSFTVLGRCRVWTEEAVVNYWTILFGDGSLKYLVEGYGMYAIQERTVIDQPFFSPEISLLKIGANRKLYKNEEAYLVEDTERCFRWEAEGELLLPKCETAFRMADFVNTMGKRVQVIEFFTDYIIPYEVFPVSVESLRLKNLRGSTDGGKKINCSHCGNEIRIVAFPYSQSYACVQCGTRYSLENSSNFSLERGRNNKVVTPAIALGATGTVKDILYQVVGFTVKEESNRYRSRWREYTLYNKTAGFAFLSEYNGHWMYLRETQDCPVLTKEINSFSYKNEVYQLYNSYGYEVVNAAGEFPYNIFNDYDKGAREFIAPPHIWIREKSKKEGITWFQGIHIPRSALKKAFGNQAVLPEPLGVGSIDPVGPLNKTKLITGTAVAVLILTLLHILTSVLCEERVLLDEYLSFKDSSNTALYVVKGIQLEKASSNLQFDIGAVVDNSWFELEANLVNTVKGDEFSLNKGVEYYYGYSGGERWSEGSRDETAYLSRIPAGTYLLQLKGMRDPVLYSFQGLKQFHLVVKYDVPNHRNFFICLALLLVWPAIRYYQISKTETERWSNSPYREYE